MGWTRALFPPELVEVSKGHGRLERRGLRASSALNQYLAGPDAPSPFPHVGQVLRISREVFALDGTRSPRRLPMGSPALRQNEPTRPG